MTMHAYAEIYLDDAMDALGEATDFAVNDCGVPIDDFFDAFIVSDIARSFECGNPRYVGGLSGIELTDRILSRTRPDFVLPPPGKRYVPGADYWTGWILAYYQWFTNNRFERLFSIVRPSEIRLRYPTLHEASEEKCVSVINAIIKKRTTQSRLQHRRQACNFSQSELAEAAGVNLRTLQQYESHAKDLKKAAVDTVARLAHVLHCPLDTILELSLPEPDAT